MKIIGLSCFYHDSAACLLDNGVITEAVQEERFTRIKHDSNFPLHSIAYILNKYNLSLDEIDYVVFYEKPFLKFERLLETYVAKAPLGFLSFKTSMPIWLRDKLFQKKLLIDELKKFSRQKIDKNKILFSEHHFSHAASAFFPSPFKEAVVLTLDGVGEWPTTTFGYGKDNIIKIDKEINFPHSLGLLYSAFTYFLGFKVNSGEYKLMGLAPYGEPTYVDDILEKLIDLKDDGSFRLNQKYFNYTTGLTMTNNNFADLFNLKRKESNESFKTEYLNLASSIQKVTEIIILKIIRYLRKRYDSENLCLAGGVALNCVANSKIIESKEFSNIWIQPASGDAGGCIGSALNVWHMHLNNDRKINKNDSMNGSLLGTSYKQEEIEIKLNQLNADFKVFDEKLVIEKTAKFLSEGKAIGWFQGRMEFGPRALGCRSILADPRSNKMQRELNLKIKFRESFRPFAPAIIKEDLKEWFDLEKDSPYMLLVAQLKKDKLIKISNSDLNLKGIDKLSIKRSLVPAITHVDNSARIQTVDKNINPKFYSLIRSFKELTNCPMLVNTSFNIRGEPIVNNPKDAYKCFMGTNLDVLVIGNCIIEKKNEDRNNLVDYRSQFELD